MKPLSAILIILTAIVSPLEAEKPGIPCPYRQAGSPGLPAFVYQEDAGEQAQSILEEVETGLGANDIERFSKHFASKVYISLLTGQKGYFSSEQSFFILRNFLRNYTPASFSYYSTNYEANNPYGVGTLRYSNLGKRGEAQVYIALARIDSRWRISQITITDR